ncbi:MAG: hypothetical protein ACYDCL_20285 [Myxococcales bacterium]
MRRNTRSDDFQNLTTQASLLLRHFAVDHAYLGESFKSQMSRFQKFAAQARLEIK